MIIKYSCGNLFPISLLMPAKLMVKLGRYPPWKIQSSHHQVTIMWPTHFKKMVWVWKTKSLLFCLRYDPLISFRYQSINLLPSIIISRLVSFKYVQSKIRSLHYMFLFISNDNDKRAKGLLNRIAYWQLNKPTQSALSFAYFLFMFITIITVFQPENSAWRPKWPLQPIFGGQIFQERANVPVSF